MPQRPARGLFQFDFLGKSPFLLRDLADEPGTGLFGSIHKGVLVQGDYRCDPVFWGHARCRCFVKTRRNVLPAQVLLPTQAKALYRTTVDQGSGCQYQHRGPKDHVSRTSPHSGPEAQDNGNSRSHGLYDPHVHVSYSQSFECITAGHRTLSLDYIMGPARVLA